ncbi:MAG TPA: antibiotic biosynthesis monooxygenase [Streptosporangiaceae bacterium]|jgi:heme-degrading monooxygenase HmoA|nr:antibiotic biosynthesis monooxygenase [Streptosporangiaceae bacterium]
MRRRVRVLVWLRTADHAGVTETYRLTSQELAGTAGLVGSELIRSLDDPASYAVVSEWESMDAFSTWEQGPAHREATTPLRHLQDRARDGGTYGVYEVTAAF